MKFTSSSNAAKRSSNLPSFFFFLQYEGFTKQNTTHIDAFLYEDDDVIDDLVDQGQMSRNYCLECGSHSTAPLSK